MALPSYMDVGNGMLKGLDTGSQMMRRYIQSKNESAETPARIALQNAQASGIPSEIALRQPNHSWLEEWLLKPGEINNFEFIYF